MFLRWKQPNRALPSYFVSLDHGLLVGSLLVERNSEEAIILLVGDRLLGRGPPR
jgi:hypothetical protein